MTERFPTKKLVLSALFAVLACVATMSIRVPTPGTGGYIHPDGAITIPYDVFLDPVSAFLAVDIGSCIADLLGGYFVCVPVTFVIKELVVLSTSHICSKLRAGGMNPYATVAGCGVVDIILVAGGYCLHEVFLYGLGAALANVPSNIIQGISGLIISNALYLVLQRSLSMVLKA